MTITVKREMSIYDLASECWSGADDFLNEVIEAGKEDLLMDFLSDIFFEEEPTLTKLNDLFRFDQYELRNNLGMNEEDEEDEEDADENEEDEY